MALESTRNLTVVQVAQSPGPWGPPAGEGEERPAASSLRLGHGARQRGDTTRRGHGHELPCHQRGAPGPLQAPCSMEASGYKGGLAFMVLLGPSFRLVPRPLFSGGAFKLRAGLPVPVRLMAAAAHRTRQKPRRLPCTTTQHCNSRVGHHQHVARRSAIGAGWPTSHIGLVQKWQGQPSPA